ncbi:sterile alpha motif domain-containing protein 9-like [Neolamprologus brichardi]|uniref:sterile alpha motif domain-containing protein 9-like n=1 Tax=Neolamprologus brichardi TaxID=32507 RepID=UPI001643E737|nr:sterile alpha motif domain-containing protein 9-like [Neolamprologus brichardi]
MADISDDVEAEILCNNYWKLCVSEFVKQNPESQNTQLFSLLVLLNAYLPNSYLRIDECQQILGPPDLIHGGPPFNERMEPFTFLISPVPEHVTINHPVIAQRSVELLHDLKINRSTTVKKLMHLLCGSESELRIAQYVKDLLTKREMSEDGQEKFSKLIRDILTRERFYHAVSALKCASEKFETNPIFPQTISRLYQKKDTTKAEAWAREAIERAPNNSYMADTLAQVYKKRLIDPGEGIFKKAREAFQAFKDVEKKAENEALSETMEAAEAESMSDTFNNRGRFGFIQVANIAFEKLNYCPADIKTKVEEEFNFFEWYLTYSKPGMSTLEPHYFWKDVALCYEHYTNKRAVDSTSFPGLLDLLNHGLFMSKGRHAQFEEPEIILSDLELIQECLKAAYEKNVEDIKLAESYILSNILLSNKKPDSPKLSPVNELKNIIHTFLEREEGSRRPEFYLLVLMLFWPENQLQVPQNKNDEEVGQKATEDSKSADSTWEDKDTDEKRDKEPGEPAQLPADLMFDINLQQYVTFMEEAFKKADYAKYLRGRYLLPLFFLGKGSGLSKWIHRSRLDAIVEEKVDAELKDKQNKKEKMRRINHLWLSGKVWHITDIRDILLPVQIEPSSSAESQELEEQEVCVCVGDQKIKARTEAQPPEPTLPTRLFYLGFTIQAPVVFEVGVLNSESDRQ